MRRRAAQGRFRQPWGFFVFFLTKAAPQIGLSVPIKLAFQQDALASKHRREAVKWDSSPGKMAAVGIRLRRDFNPTVLPDCQMS